MFIKLTNRRLRSNSAYIPSRNSVLRKAMTNIITWNKSNFKCTAFLWVLCLQMNSACSPSRMLSERQSFRLDENVEIITDENQPFNVLISDVFKEDVRKVFGAPNSKN